MSNLSATFQEHQSAIFLATNKDLIEQVRGMLIKGAESLAWAIIGTKASLATEIYEKIPTGNLDGLFVTIRPMAVHFVDAHLSGQFWSWVDAAGFLRDSIGTHWKYLTIEQRQKYLEWARQDAQQVLSQQ